MYIPCPNCRKELWEDRTDRNWCLWCPNCDYKAPIVRNEKATDPNFLYTVNWDQPINEGDAAKRPLVDPEKVAVIAENLIQTDPKYKEILDDRKTADDDEGSGTEGGPYNRHTKW